MEVKLNPNEKIEDLQCKGLVIIQSATEYRFTTDAVLLANFCRDMKGKFCVEFGTGSGVISLLLAKKKHPAHVVAMEIQPVLADMAARSVALNDLQEQIEVVCCDLKQAQRHLGRLADVVVCNPPYRKLGSGEIQQAESVAICRHEIKATLADVIENAAKVLNNRGAFYLVHQACRICEIVCLCREHNLAVKEILPVAPRPDAEPNLVLVRAVKGGASDCVLHKPMSVLDSDGNYTPEAKAWYGLALGR